MRSLFPHARALFGSGAGLAAVLAVGVAVHAQGAAPAPAAAPPAAAPPAAGPPAAAAGPPQPLTEEVVAHVNDEVITNYDIIQRMRLLVVTAGIQPSRDDLPQLQRYALSSLVDERLEMQELRHKYKHHWGLAFHPATQSIHHW